MSQPTPPSPPTSSVARAPTLSELLLDRAFRGGALGLSLFSFLLLALLVAIITYQAWPALQKFGGSMLTGMVWSPGEGKYGILPHIFGTLYSSVLALVLATVLGVATAVFLTEDFLPLFMRVFFKNVVELLAAIPSVVYGLWGFFVVIPSLRPMAEWLHENAGWFPLFGTPYGGNGMLPATIVLAIMILPTITAIARDAIASVPVRLREASYGMGATRWQTILRVILPTASTGILGAILLAFGRALGETMALAMLIGNRADISWSILSPATTLAALMALTFPEATGMQTAALMVAALVLLVITLLVNMLGSFVVWRSSSHLRGQR